MVADCTTALAREHLRQTPRIITAMIRRTLTFLVILWAGASVASAGSEVIARLKGFTAGEVRQARFELTRKTTVELDGIGAGAGRGKLYAYSWLVKSDSGERLWSMADDEPRKIQAENRNLYFAKRLALEPGRYTLYYFPGRRHLAPGALTLKALFGPSHEVPADWYVAARVAQSDVESIVAVSAHADPADRDVLRLAPLSHDVHVRQRFHLRQDASVDILAFGEAYAKENQLADHSWLMELESRRIVWQMNAKRTKHAGGARKNRQFTGSIDLPAGDYELVAVTDDSHSYQDWNALPPSVPDAWGVTLIAPAGTIDTTGVPEERIIARLLDARDDETLSATFELETATLVRIYVHGEWSGGHGGLVDHGWIEEAETGRRVWQMKPEASRHAGGGDKNIVIDTALLLAPGRYRAVYQTDDSHSSQDWNALPPFDRLGWGIQVSTFNPAARWELVEFLVSGL